MEMANYLLLYTGGGSMPASEAEAQAVLKVWTDWYTAMGEAVVDPGNPFTPAVKSIASSGKVSDGPVGALASGYSVIKAGSLEEAVTWARGCPLLASGGQITVYETFNVM
jgi:hypothetical protein